MPQDRSATARILLICLTTVVSGWTGKAFSAEGAAAGAPEGYSNTFASSRPEDVHTAEADGRIAKADQHLALGKQLYFKGDLPGARREFDLAVDALLNAPENLPDRHRIERKLDEVSDLIYRFDIEKLGAGQTSDDLAFDQAPIDQLRDMTFPVDESLLPKVNFELKQTASAIPLELSDPVLAYIHYFSTDHGRKVLLSGFRRAGRYKPMIERILAEEGAPEELIYLAQAESGFLPRAISRAHAMGMWQFIAGTGQLYALVRDSSVDDRFDPEKATRAAARLLKDLYQRYGDWYLAMAAYNCGAGNVDRAVERTGYADYWKLLELHALPKETANYVPIILAMTIMAKNPKDYGLDDIEEDGPLELDTVHLGATTNVALIADAAQQPVSLVRELNPSLLSSLAPAGYSLHVPKGTGESTLTALESVPSANRNAWRLHHVAAGETLQTIARQYHVGADRIVAVNSGSDSLDAGDTLLIPAVYHPPASPSPTRGRRASRAHIAGVSAAVSRSNATRHNTKPALPHVSSNILHRRAAVRTASLHR
ncbi:MAG: transglycosylase SLT domain-containing protein [Bryobacteraceae bacterium]